MGHIRQHKSKKRSWTSRCEPFQARNDGEESFACVNGIANASSSMSSPRVLLRSINVF